MRIIESENAYDAKLLTSEFLTMKRQQGVTKPCLDQHRYALIHLHKGIDKAPEMADVYRCLPPTMGSGYYNKRLTTYRQYFTFCKRLGRTLNWSISDIHYKKKKYHIVNHENCEVQTLLQSFNQKTFAGLRDYVLTMFILDTGTRPSEVVRILPEDINYTERECTLRAEITKTHEERIVPISTKVLMLIRKLLHYHLPEWGKTTVFCNDWGKELKTTGYRNRCKQVCDRNQIHITPYELRHIFATNYIRNGGDPFTLQKILGHASLNTTRIYVNLNTKDLHLMHEKANVISQFSFTKNHFIGRKNTKQNL